MTYLLISLLSMFPYTMPSLVSSSYCFSRLIRRLADLSLIINGLILGRSREKRMNIDIVLLKISICDIICFLIYSIY